MQAEWLVFEPFGSHVRLALTELEALELLARREQHVLQASLGIVDQAEPPTARKEPTARPSIEI